MIDDNTPHRVFKISEPTRLIASQLVITSLGSAVSLACACRYLEEPVLCVLWETQESFECLLETLPGGVWNYESVGMVRGPGPPLGKLNALSSWLH